MLTEVQARRNIRRFARLATPEQWREGAQWYPDAHKFCAAIAERTDCPVERIVATLAALSPQCNWEENKRATDALSTYGNIGTTICYPANIKKAQRLQDGEGPLDVLGGKKVLAFFYNILYPTSSLAVTVDTHAARAAFNLSTLDRRITKWVFDSHRQGNTVIQNAYRAVAKEERVLPSTLQATVWLVVKSELAKGWSRHE